MCLSFEVCRSSPPEVFLGKGVLKICCKFISMGCTLLAHYILSDYISSSMSKDFVKLSNAEGHYFQGTTIRDIFIKSKKVEILIYNL